MLSVNHFRHETVMVRIGENHLLAGPGRVVGSGKGAFSVFFQGRTLPVGRRGSFCLMVAMFMLRTH
ncbi:MAG: hypothetical protein H7836_07170 [Magnetococcus sp. YQC-3]